MAKRKFRKHRKRGVIKKGSFSPLVVPVKSNRKVKPETLDSITQEIALTESDRLTYSYEKDSRVGKIVNVVNVSYEVKTEKGWVTLVHYDSEHGFLHRHMRLSTSNPAETVSRAGVIKKGKPGRWLSWAIKDITKNFPNYRVGFFKRSGIDNLY